MSQENVEIVKRVLDAFNRRDFVVASELTTGDYEFLSPMFDSQGSSIKGRESVAAYHRETFDTWEEYRLVADEYRDLGDSVLVLGCVEGRGKGSGVPVTAPWAAIYELRDGRLFRARPFLDHDEALRAADLTEESG